MDLSQKVLNELKKDFTGYENHIVEAFTLAETFSELAIDYYRCKRLIAFFTEQEKVRLRDDYSDLLDELKVEIQEYITKTKNQLK